MAYTESVEYDQITVTNPYSSVGVRKSVVVKKDGVEIANMKHTQKRRFITALRQLDADYIVIDSAPCILVLSLIHI